MAQPERGLFDSDEDLAAYLARMTQPREPVRTGYEHVFSPNVMGRINAEIQPGYRDSQGNDVPRQITPSIGATLGPLSLDGGLQLQQATNPDTGASYTQATPTFGAGLKLPLFGGDAELKAKYTPEQLKLLEAEWKKKIFNDTGELSLYGNYSQPAGDAPPAWGVGIRGRIPF